MAKFKLKGFNAGNGTGSGLTFTNAQRADGSQSHADYVTRTNFDASGLDEELKNNPNAMIAEDLLSMREGEFGRSATLQDKRELYQKRARGNSRGRAGANTNNLESWTYTDPRTGAQKTMKNKNYVMPDPVAADPVAADTPSVDVSSSKVKKSGGNRSFGEKAGTLSNSGGGGNPDRRSRRKSRQLARQTRRANRKAARQKNREMHGGFFRRLIDKIF